jgi:hypothetical protein
MRIQINFYTHNHRQNTGLIAQQILEGLKKMGFNTKLCQESHYDKICIAIGTVFIQIHNVQRGQFSKVRGILRTIKKQYGIPKTAICEFK